MYHLFIPWLLLALSILLGLLLVSIVITWGIDHLMAASSNKTAAKASHGRKNNAGVRWSLGSAAVLFIVIIAINCSEEVFSVGVLFNRRFQKDEGEKTFKVLSYNVHAYGPGFSAERLKQLIESEDPDYIFLAESGWVQGIFDAMASCPYQISMNTGGWVASKYEYGEHIDMMPARSIMIGYSDIQFVCSHLASNNTYLDDEGKDVYMPPDSLESFSSLMKYLRNCDRVSEKRDKQVRTFCDSLRTGKPTIIMGDMNDVGGSEALKQLKKAGFRDAWWTGGFGYGATYHEPLPFRIDHIYYSPELHLRDIRILRSADWGTESVPLSDHDALVATFSIP